MPEKLILSAFVSSAAGWKKKVVFTFFKIRKIKKNTDYVLISLWFSKIWLSKTALSMSEMTGEVCAVFNFFITAAILFETQREHR